MAPAPGQRPLSHTPTRTPSRSQAIPSSSKRLTGSPPEPVRDYFADRQARQASNFDEFGGGVNPLGYIGHTFTEYGYGPVYEKGQTVPIECSPVSTTSLTTIRTAVVPPPPIPVRDIEGQMERAELEEIEGTVPEQRELRYSSSPVVRPPVFVFWKGVFATSASISLLVCSVSTRQARDVPFVCASAFATAAGLLSACRVLRFYLAEEAEAIANDSGLAGDFAGTRKDGNWFG